MREWTHLLRYSLPGLLCLTVLGCDALVEGTQSIQLYVAPVSSGEVSEQVILQAAFGDRRGAPSNITPDDYFSRRGTFQTIVDCPGSATLVMRTWEVVGAGYWYLLTLRFPDRPRDQITGSELDVRIVDSAGVRSTVTLVAHKGATVSNSSYVVSIQDIGQPKPVR